MNATKASKADTDRARKRFLFITRRGDSLRFLSNDQLILARSKGRRRILLPVAAKAALHKAGAAGGNPGWPTTLILGPPSARINTSTAGISLMRSMRLLWKLDWTDRPFSKVTASLVAATRAITMAPSVWALTISGFTTVPRSMTE